MILETADARAEFDPLRGGRLASLRVFDEELLVTRSDEVIGWGCYPMAPWAGRIRRARLLWEGETYSLTPNLPPHAIHGTVYERPWDVLTSGRMAVSLGPGWPWKGRVESVVELSEGRLTWRLSVHADRSAMPVTLGWHPWFRRRLGVGGDLTLSFEAGAVYLRDADGIPTGECGAPPSGPWDDCFRDLAGPPSLEWPGFLKLAVESDASHWVIYDEPAHALCVEPQSGPPDAVHLGEAQIARPGRPVTRTMTLNWSSICGVR